MINMSYDEDGTYWPDESEIIEIAPLKIVRSIPVREYRETYHLPRTARVFHVHDMDFWFVGRIDSEDREIVVLECSMYPFLLPFYKTHSGLDTWRLYLPYHGGYQKGPDYVQSNLMYLPLQLWVNVHHHEMPTLRIQTIEYDKTLRESFMAVMNDEARIINREIELPEEIAQSLFHTYKKGKSFSSYLSSPSCGKLTKLSSVTENEQYLSGLVSLLFRAGREERVGSVYSEVEMEAHFRFHQEIMRVPMNSLISFFPDLTLYYSLYNMKYQREDIKVECNHYRIPLFLGTDSCNEFGLFSSYLTIGNYVCKVLDYNSQVPSFIRDAYKCSSTYTFIGHLYNELYPFPLHQSTVTTNQLEPGKNVFGYARDLDKQGRKSRKSRTSRKRKHSTKKHSNRLILIR